MSVENGDVFPCLKIDQVFEFQLVFVDNPRLITVLPVGSQQAILSLQRIHPGVSFLTGCTTQDVHGFLITDDFPADLDAGILHQGGNAVPPAVPSIRSVSCAAISRAK